jgi:hypothetical protein
MVPSDPGLDRPVRKRFPIGAVRLRVTILAGRTEKLVRWIRPAEATLAYSELESDSHWGNLEKVEVLTGGRPARFILAFVRIDLESLVSNPGRRVRYSGLPATLFLRGFMHGAPTLTALDSRPNPTRDLVVATAEARARHPQAAAYSRPWLACFCLCLSQEGKRR